MERRCGSFLRGVCVAIFDSVTARRRFLRRCAIMCVSPVVLACTQTPPQAPAVAPTIAPELVTSIPTLTPLQTITPTSRVALTTTPRSQLPPAPVAAEASLVDVGDFAELVKRAQAEGELSVIGLSREWLNYGEIIESYKNTYGIRIIEQSPDASSSQQIATIHQTAGQRGIQVPDVIDVGADVASIAAQTGLLQPYRVQVWDEVPPALRDVAGYWTGGYYGVMAFAINADVVKSPPKGWKELQNPLFKSQFALSADPHMSLTVQYAVISAALANQGTPDDVLPGLQTMASLRQSGVLSDRAGNRNSVTIGETPIVPMWSFVAYALKMTTANNPQIAVVLPEPLVGAAYAHAINAYATHPYAARLWLEHVMSTPVQLMYAKAMATPARVSAMLASNAFPADILARIPTAAKMAKALFLTPTQQLRASELIASQWDSIVQLTIIQ